MPLTTVVRNQAPSTSADVPEPLLNLFQEFGLRGHQRLLPFTHQAEVFRLVGEENGEVLLVAGTAAGKTLAIAVPLLWKLKEGIIRRVVLMYPTVALLEDQRNVMDTLAEITDLEVGQLQGGMSRSQLIAALNKPIILATPDEVYWFFRKNVKYSSLLIYGLALVDEFVLDEAHLFNGLMLRNLSHLRRRIQLLGDRLGRRSRWHVLTATPTQGLRSLTDGVEVEGRSKCGDVTVTFLEPTTDYIGRKDRLMRAVEAALTEGAEKVLLVLNSADLAHRVFEDIGGKSRPDLPMNVRRRFGHTRWGDFRAWMDQEGIESQTVNEIEQWMKREEELHLKDLPQGAQVTLHTEVLVAKIARLLEVQSWALKRLSHAAARGNDDELVDVVEQKLAGRGRLPNLLWTAITPSLATEASVELVLETVDAWVSAVGSALERTWSETDEESLSVTAPAFAEIAAALHKAGMSPELADRITVYLRHTVELPEEATDMLRMSPSELTQRQVALSWLEWLVEDPSRRETLVRRLENALVSGDLAVETRHIAVWQETGIPVVIYSGKMSKAARTGLIEAFAALPQAVLISTPAVEVGVDFAADTLITEQCDGNGFLQRFGRVGRRPGIQGRVVVLTRDGETYVQLYQRHQPHMTREAFSTLMAHPADGVFPTRRYAEGSAFLDATHWLVNAQLGEIGQWLNQAMFGDGEAAGLARDLRAAHLPFAYGLRGTLAGVGLRGGADGGEPFYILRKVPNERLLSSDSPFEMAQADMWYLEFLWRRSLWKIAVDAKATLESSQALFWWRDGQWHLRAGPGIAADYARLFDPIIAPNLRGLEARVRGDLTGLLDELRPHATKPKVRPILRVGGALPMFFEPHAHFILGQGDVHLLRVDQDEISDAVEDRLGNPLVFPDQTWLILYGCNREKAEQLLGEISALGLEEVIYDWDTLEVPGSLGPVLLDRVAGACFDIYRRLVAYVGG